MPNIGPIHLAVPFCQAGLAGYSDRAMRVVARRRGCPYAVTEALLDTILLSGGEGLRRSIDVNDEDHPVAGQIIGSEPEQMARAAVILQQRGYDVIDLNYACPVKKIKNKARGGHMLRDLPRALEMLRQVRDALPPETPTTVSLRRSFDDAPESVDLFHAIVEAAWEHGYSAVRVHGRTVEQKYQGRAHWPVLRELKQRYPDRTILGSGDVFTAEDAVRMLRETGVDVVWIARGAIGNPWIFRHAAQLLAQGSGVGVQAGTEGTASLAPLNAEPSTLNPPTIHEQRDALAEHFAMAMEINGEQLAGRRMRKMGIKYSRFHPRAADVKAEFINVRSLRDWRAVLDRWCAIDGPGVWPDPRAADEVNDGGAAETSCEAPREDRGASPPMHSKVPPRNRLAKVLPEEWRKLLVSQGVPKRKYTAVCRATLAGGRVIEEMIVEEGWIIALGREGLAGTFEQRIDFDPRLITDVRILQVV